MRYFDGSEIELGHIVRVPVPSGTSSARVVMLGDTYAHAQVDKEFLSWVKDSRVLRPSSIVIEWIEANPFANEDPKFATTGNYMFTDVDEFVEHDVKPFVQPDLPSAGRLPPTLSGREAS